MICLAGHRDIRQHQDTYSSHRNASSLLEYSTRETRCNNLLSLFSLILSFEVLASMLWHFVPYGYDSQQQQQAWFYLTGITVPRSNYHVYFHPFQMVALMNITGRHRLFFPQRLHYYHAILTWFPRFFYGTKLLSLPTWCYTLSPEWLAFWVRKICLNTAKMHSELRNITGETSSGSTTIDFSYKL